MDRYAFETPSSQQFHHPDQKAAWLAGYALPCEQAIEEALVWLD
jgi:hypothetical protein